MSQRVLAARNDARVSVSPRHSVRSICLVCLLAVGSGFVYISRLNWSPPYLSIEEVGHARQVESLATTGRSLSGQLLPLWVAEPGYQAGREPLWIYATVLLLKVVPFSEAVLRLPSAIAGAAGILLMFLRARRVFGSDIVGVLAAVLLAAMPAYFIYSRLATSQIGPVPFMLAWLLCLARYLDTNRRRDLLLSTLWIGLGVYSYLAAAVMAPLFFAATLAIAATTRRSEDLFAACAGFIIALVPWIVWNVAHPHRFSALLDYYTHNGYNAALAASNSSVLRVIVDRLDLWWHCWNPEEVFFSGDGSLHYSTREAGYLLLPTVLLIVAGLRALWKVLPPTWRALALGGLLSGPLPALFGGDYEIKRWLSVLPFIAIVMACSVKQALESRRWLPCAAVAGVFILSVVQFVGFWRDYQSEYRARSSFYLLGNLKGAIENVVANPPQASCIFLDGRTGVAPYWDLYSRVLGKSHNAHSSPGSSA
jgi:4-amino-4-deoxy-L-arabinose transferase-like glycosyltransferase